MQISEWSSLYPELWLVSMTCLVLIVDLWVSRWSKWIPYLLCQFTLVVVLLLTVQNMGENTTLILNNMFIRDDVGSLLKFFMALFGIFVFFYSRRYLFEKQQYRSEYFVLCLFSIFGMMIMVSSMNFLSLYLGIELMALPLYALITLVREDQKASEAAMKYFIMGALASGMMLYGISLLYGVTGSFGLAEISAKIGSHEILQQHTLLLGLVFILIGFAFKFGAVPFHMWLPDVYQGSPIAVTLFIGTLPKLAAFGFAIRLFISTFETLNPHWQSLLMMMAVLSLGVGNLVAIAQKNLKRMLGYSTIGHMGFLFLGLIAGPQSGFSAALDYVLIYALMALGVFGLMTILSDAGFEVEEIQDLKGLGQRRPWLGFLMMLILLSLAGIPPFAGFFAKFFVLDALIQAGQVELAIIAVLATVIGAYYYLRVIRVMYFDKPEDGVEIIPALSNELSSSELLLFSFNGLALLVLGLFPAFLIHLCEKVLALPQ